MDRFNFFVSTGRRHSTPAMLSTATQLEIAATVLCGLAVLIWVAAAMSAIAFRHQVAMNPWAAASQGTYVELPSVVVSGQRDFSGEPDRDSIHVARADGSAQQPSLAN